MVIHTKEACQEIFAEPMIFTISRMHGGITLADMEAIFGRLVRSDSRTGGEHNAIMLESENQERTRVFNFTEIPITKIGQDGIRQVIAPVDTTEFAGVLTPNSTQGLNRPAWWSALAKTQNKPHDLVNKIVVARSRFFLGRSIHEIKNQLRMSRLSEGTFEKLLTSNPFTAYYGGKRIQAIYAMFMYVVDISDFKGYLHLHERSTDTFVSICDAASAPAHPRDVSNTIVDCRAINEPAPRQGLPLITYRLVYHDHLPRTRYLREGCTIVQLNPEKDLTTQEGFYKQHYVPSRPEIGPGSVEHTFVPLEKLTEEDGFYLSREGAAENRTEQEMLALRKQQQTESDQVLKAWLNALQADTKASAAQYKEFYENSLKAQKDALNLSDEKFQQWTQSMSKERDALKDQINQLKEEVKDRKRVHEENMLERKELLEALKLIPAVITIVGAFIALGQKGKKK